MKLGQTQIQCVYETDKFKILLLNFYVAFLCTVVFKNDLLLKPAK